MFERFAEAMAAKALRLAFLPRKELNMLTVEFVRVDFSLPLQLNWNLLAYHSVGSLPPGVQAKAAKHNVYIS